MTALKKILSLLLVISMFACMLSLTACGKPNHEEENNDNSGNNVNDGNNVTNDNTYTVTVLDGDNNPVEGVKLVITNDKTYPTATTDKDGKASAQFDEATTVSVMVTSVPDGYLKPEKVSGVYHGVFASGAKDLTLKIEKEADNKVTYTVKVVDQNGDEVVGMVVLNKESDMKTINTPNPQRVYAALAQILERKHGVKINYQLTPKTERRTS